MRPPQTRTTPSSDATESKLGPDAFSQFSDVTVVEFGVSACADLSPLRGGCVCGKD